MQAGMYQIQGWWRPAPNVHFITSVVVEMETGVSFSGNPLNLSWNGSTRLPLRIGRMKLNEPRSLHSMIERTWDLAAGQALDFAAWRATLISD